MDTKEAIEIIERLKDVYGKVDGSEKIVTALSFAIDSLVIVHTVIEEDWGDDE